jgi:hypothetical protein
MCTLESNPPTVHKGAKKLSVNAKPFGQPEVLVKFFNAKEGVLWKAFDVAAGMAMMIAMMRRTLSHMKTCWSLARTLVAPHAMKT